MNEQEANERLAERRQMASWITNIILNPLLLCCIVAIIVILLLWR